MSTPHTPYPPHIDVDTLADLDEGLLEAEQVSSVAEHLAGCAECRARRAALDDVQLLLRDRGGEADGGVPDDVVRRLDDALAAAATPLPTASATVIPLTASTARPRQPWRTRVLQAAAVFVLVAAVGGLGYGAIRASSGGNSTTSASDSAGAGATAKRSEAHRYVVTSSGRNYTKESLRTAVPELLSGKYDATAQESGGAPLASKVPSAHAPSAGSIDPQRLRDGKALTACVNNLAGTDDGPVTPLAVDIARFDGKPATIIVLPDPKDPSVVFAYAVAPDCAEGTFLAALPVTLP
jgi:hypothetical protein